MSSSLQKISIKKLRVSFKNTTEVASAIKKMNLEKAKIYLKKVIDKKAIIPFKKFNNGVGKSSMLTQNISKQGRYVTKSCLVLLKLLLNITVRTRILKENPGQYFIRDININRNAYRTRTIFRAFGRANRIRSSICSIELVIKKYGHN